MRRATQVATIIGLLVLILGLVEAQFHPIRGLLRGRALGSRELAMEFLGRYLATQCAGKTAIVLSNPFSDHPGQPREVYDFEQAGIRGLRRGLGTAVRIEQIVFPQLRPEAVKNPRAVHMPAGTTTPLSYLVAENALDDAAHQCPNAELIVSLIGLPANACQTETWRPDNPRKFALLLPDLRMVGNQAAIRQALQNRKIIAFVLNKPGAPPENQPAGKDARMEFESRFLLITPETAEQYLQAYPRLF